MDDEYYVVFAVKKIPSSILSSINFVISQCLIEDQHISSVGRGWCLTWCWTFWSYFTIGSRRCIAGRMCIGVRRSRSIRKGRRFAGAVRRCQSAVAMRVGDSVGGGFGRATAGCNRVRRCLSVGVWACGME